MKIFVDKYFSSFGSLYQQLYLFYFSYFSGETVTNEYDFKRLLIIENIILNGDIDGMVNHM